MIRLIFWDVDTQHDFIRADGRLYIPGSTEIVPVLEALTDFAHEHRTPIVASADDHEPSDPEISDAPDWRDTFPPHCMHGTPGQLKIAETALRDLLVIDPELQDPGALAHRVLAHRGDFLLRKHSVDVFSNVNVATLLRTLEPDAIVLYGVATDYCNRYAVEGLLSRLPRTEICLVTDAIRAIDAGEGSRLVSDWERRGVRLADSAQILHGGLLEPYLPAAVV
jgi:nicotinamidase/pyrazinamidase